MLTKLSIITQMSFSESNLLYEYELILAAVADKMCYESDIQKCKIMILTESYTMEFS